MRFKLDENLHDEVLTLLTDHGHDVHTVRSENLRGCDDAALARHCHAENRAIITLDLDFADIRAYPPADFPGLIVLRVSSQSRKHVRNVMGRVVELLQREPVNGHLWIVSDADIRVRGE